MRSDMPAAVPPAPGRWPVLGHVPMLVARPLQFVRAQREAITLVHLGHLPAFLVNDPTLVRRILVSDAAAFDKGIHYEKLGGLLGGSLSTTTGTAHRDRRRRMQPAFHHDQVAGYATLMREATNETIDRWPAGGVIAVDAHMRALALTIVTRALCSADLDDDAEETIRRDLPAVLRGVAWRVLLPATVRLPGRRRWAAATARLRAVVMEVVERRRRADGGEADLLGLLLRSGDPHTGAPLSDEQVRDEVVNVLFAGTETTGNALAWVWHELAHRTDLVQRIREGDQGLAERVALETLRLHPPPWLVSRRARCAVRLGAHVIPSGAQVLFSPYAVQRDPANFSAASAFDPDRWLAERDEKGTRTAFLAFGVGRQNCIGKGFALLEMTTVITTVLNRFRLAPVTNVRARARATLAPAGGRMRVHPWSGIPTSGADR